MYDIEKLYQAKDIGDAIRALKEDPEAVVISGGSDVLIKVREGKLAGCSLVSIHGIKELEGVRMEEDGTIVIGPATTFSHVTNNRIIQKYIPILGDAVDQAGGPQLRNIGTVGGNVCNGVTGGSAGDSDPRVVYRPRKDGKAARRDTDCHPDPQGVLRGLWRPLHQVRQEKRHGDRYHGLRGHSKADRR